MYITPKHTDMSEAKIKIKIGEYQFKAEGSADWVKDQFATFKELVASLGSQPTLEKRIESVAPNGISIGGTVTLDKIMSGLHHGSQCDIHSGALSASPSYFYIDRSNTTTTPDP